MFHTFKQIFTFNPFLYQDFYERSKKEEKLTWKKYLTCKPLCCIIFPWITDRAEIIRVWDKDSFYLFADSGFITNSLLYNVIQRNVLLYAVYLRRKAKKHFIINSSYSHQRNLYIFLKFVFCIIFMIIRNEFLWITGMSGFVLFNITHQF